jgi:hypothetical protein
MRRLFRRITAGAATAAAVAGVLTVGATPAAAATVTMEYRCAYMHIVFARTYDITITAPATASTGQPVTVTATVASRHPLSQDEPAGAYRGEHVLTLGGAASGDFTVKPLSSPPLQAGEPWRLSGSSRITFDNPGTVTFKPGLVGLTRPLTQGCIPANANTAPVAATTRVS